jgi:hypothetical protein
VDRVLPLGKLEGAVSHDVKILILGELRAGGVVLTASGLGKLFNDRSRSRAWMIFFGSARTGIG